MEDDKIKIRVPAGSKGLVKPGKGTDNGKMILPPGKLRVAERDENGTLVLDIVEQDDANKVLSDIERRTQKASTTMVGDEKREASKVIDSIKKKKNELMQRTGVSTKKSVNFLQIAENNQSIIDEVKNFGGAAFDIFEMSQESKQQLQAVNERYGTQYLDDIDDAYDEFTDTIRKVLDDYRNPTDEAQEEEAEVSAVFKKVLERKDNEEIIEILEKLAVQIHAGMERFISIPAEPQTLELLQERKMFQRFSASGSQNLVQKDSDLTLGLSVVSSLGVRPIAANIAHAGHKIPNDVKKNKSFKPEFYSESEKPKLILKPEVFGRSGYTRNAGIFDTAYSVSSVSTEVEKITLAVLGGVSSKNSLKKNIEILDVYLEAAVTGDYSEIIGTKENPGFRAYLLGGFMKDEIELLEYPLSSLDTDSVKIAPRDVVLGEDVIKEKMKRSNIPEQGFNDLIEQLKKLKTVKIYLHTKAADKVKLELSQLNISNIRFVNPDGIDIFDPYSFQDVETRLLESGSRIVSINAIKEVDAAIKAEAEKVGKKKRGNK